MLQYARFQQSACKFWLSAIFFWLPSKELNIQTWCSGLKSTISCFVTGKFTETAINTRALVALGSDSSLRSTNCRYFLASHPTSASKNFLPILFFSQNFCFQGSHSFLGKTRFTNHHIVPAPDHRWMWQP